MKKILYSVAGMVALLSATDLSADDRCPVLTAEDVSKYQCPVKGTIYNPSFPDFQMTYTRSSAGSVGDVCRVFKNWASKKTLASYSGTPSDKVSGQVFCEYQLPDQWKKVLGLEQGPFILMHKVVSTPTSMDIRCPELDEKNIREPNINSGDVKWLATLEIWLKLTSETRLEEQSISGVLSNQTVKFQHTCTYNLDDKEDGEKLVLNGVMKTS